MRKRSAWIAVSIAAVMSVSGVLCAAALSDNLTEGVAVAAEAEETVPDEEWEEEKTGLNDTETEAANETEEETESETETETEEQTGEDEERPVELVAVIYEEENAWADVAITNSDYVETAVNIHTEADENSDIIGFLYKGAAVWVLERTDNWTEIYSNGMTGYIMSCYLLYDADVAEIAEIYGVEGVMANWDGVNLYTSDDASTVKGTAVSGDTFQVVNDYGHWIEVEYGDDATAFVSSEDVTSVLLFESATPKDGERFELVKLYGYTYPEAEDYGDSDVYSEDSYEGDTSYSTGSSYNTGSSSSGTASTGSSSTGSASTGSSSTGSSSTGSSSTGSSSTGSSSAASSSSGGSSSSSSTASSSGTVTQTEAPAQTEATVVETPATETVEPDYSQSGSSSGEGYYDAGTDTYYDGDGNPVTYASPAVDTSSASVSSVSDTSVASASSTSSVSDTSVAPASSTSSVSDTSAASASNADDTTLLAALIYCEAGNQEYEGMVAVGAVVMNRVNSSLFPNSIREVIYQTGQFGPASRLDTVIANGVPSACYSAASAAICGENPVGSALYFNTVAGQGIKIGDHWFY